MSRRLFAGLVATALVLPLAGCTVQWVSDPADDRVVLPKDTPSSVAALPSDVPAVERFSDVCYDLNDFEETDMEQGISTNEVGVLGATYHAVGRAHELAAKVQVVNAGNGYWVVVGVVHNDVTAWLAWDTQFPDASPYGNFRRWSEIKSVEDWDGGPIPFGTQALASALRCLG